MTTALDESLLDIVAPPPGYHFDVGLWVTHDLNPTALVDDLLPALLGVSASERRRRRGEARAATPNSLRLAVLAAADRVAVGAAMADNAVVARVGGNRRQHAKFAVLCYVREHATGNTHGRVFRALVMSANVTAGGLRNNREILRVDSLGSNPGPRQRPFLGVDLLAIADDLVASVIDGDGAELVRPLIADLRSSLPRVATGTGDLVESVTTAHDLLHAAFRKPPTRRLVLLSPAFTRDQAGGVVALIARQRATRVDLYAEEGAQGERAVLSSSLVDALQAKGIDVRVWAVPRFEPVEDDGPARPRPLHAKLFAGVDDSGEVSAWAGSANVTAHGLGGLNRELMARLPLYEEQDLDEFLAQLGARQVHELESPGVVEPEPTGQDPCPLVATFHPATHACARHRRWPGHLHLDGLDESVTRDVHGIVHAGQSLSAVPEQTLVLDQDVAALEVTWRDDVLVLPVRVVAPDDFWQDIEADDEPGDQDDDFRRLLMLLRPATAGRTGRGGTRAGAAPAQEDSAFRLPLNTVLPLLVRRRTDLVRIPSRRLEEALARLRDTAQDSEAAPQDAHDVALAVAAAHHPELPERPDPDTRTITLGVRALDRGAGR